MKQIQNSKKGELSNIVLGLLFTVAFVTLYFSWIGDGITQYGVTPPSGYNESYYIVQGVYSNLSVKINQTYDQLQAINSDTGGIAQVVDFLGFFFSSAYRAAQIAVRSVLAMFGLVDVSISNLPLGTNGAILKGLGLLGLTAIGVFLLMKYVFKIDI